jgi:hypothetical protein
MAKGDAADIFARLRHPPPHGVLPPWFGDGGANTAGTPILDMVLSGIAAPFVFVWSLIVFVLSQARIATASDWWLDLIAFDFFGLRIQRYSGETDDAFRIRIIKELFRERVTRHGLSLALQDLTGFAPAIFEPRRPADTGGWGPGPSGDGIGRGLAYSVATGGGYGSLMLPFQLFVTVYRAPPMGIPYISGYGQSAGGWGAGPGGDGIGRGLEYVSLAMMTGGITDALIYSTIEAVRPVGYTIWVRIQPPPGLVPSLDYSKPADSQYLPGLNV